MVSSITHKLKDVLSEKKPLAFTSSSPLLVKVGMSHSSRVLNNKPPKPPSKVKLKSPPSKAKPSKAKPLNNKPLNNKPNPPPEEDSKVLMLKLHVISDHPKLDQLLPKQQLPKKFNKFPPKPQSLNKPPPKPKHPPKEDTEETEEIEDTTDERVTLFLYESVSK
jgi:hypothetical protein